MKIVTVEQMRRIEAQSEESGVSTDTLMENAGLAVARRVRHHMGHLKGRPVVILVGPGNNGGDGLVAARHLHRWRARVTVYLCTDRKSPDPKLDAIAPLGVPVVAASQDPGLTKLTGFLNDAHGVVDAILGTGRARPLQGVLQDVLRCLTDIRRCRPDLFLLALDLPTGLNADTGEVDPLCPGADVTVALGHAKAGMLQFPGAGYTGTLEVEDIGLPTGLDSDVGLTLMREAWASGILPIRATDAHKGSFGRALVVAGSRNYIGAAYLASTAATRVGAGLVTVAIPESLVGAVAAKAIEPTFLPLPEEAPGTPSAHAAEMILGSLDGYDALLVGCGMGREPTTEDLVRRLLLSGESLPPTAVDADGLNIIAGAPSWWEGLHDQTVLTPHPGEMARLTGLSGAGVQADRLGAATRSASAWGKVVVLKGAHTIVAAPDGTGMVSPFANPGLATAGTGDVLAGIIVGLLSQHVALGDAASLGVFLHGRAGERVREEMGDAGMVASDLLPVLPRVIHGLLGARP